MPMDTPTIPNLPIRDLGSFANAHVPSDADIKDHRHQETVYIGLQLPKHHHGMRRRRHHKHKKTGVERIKAEETDNSSTTPPRMRIQYLLGEDDDDEHTSHELFCELEELITVDGKEPQWKETARWIKFEEDVEEGGERWSKPHVATLSLHSLFELRCGLMNGTVMLDCEANDIHFVFDMLVDNLIAAKQLEENLKDKVLDTLYLRHHHQYQKKHHEDGNSGRFHLPIIRSLADIGKKFSAPALHNNGRLKNSQIPKSQTAVRLDKYKANSLSTAKTTPNFGRAQSSHRLEASGTLQGSLAPSEDDSEGPSSTGKLNLHFMKKIPPGAEAANILVGEVDFLTNHQIVAFIRLLKPVMADLTEVPVPTKFLFVLLGPMGNSTHYHEIGRSIATLFSDEVFRDVAYHAHNREDLLTGIDEFLDQVTVLPPGEWDPTIRIEPPKSVPSQDSRRQPTGSNLPNGKPIPEDQVEGGENQAETLQRTGRLFGGLIADIKRKAPFYISDFKDALHVQCVASFIFLYFACLTPIITFGGLLGDATGNNMAAFESLLAGCIVGVIYALCSGQPLTILGSTGPVLVFETILYDICDGQKWDYLEVRLWVGMWTFICLMIMVVFDLSALVRYITRFTEESFALLIALIFIKEAIAKLISISHSHPVKLGTKENPYYECCCDQPSNTSALNTNASSPMNVTIANSSFINASSPLNVTIANNSFIIATEDQWHLMNCTYCLEMGGVVKFEGCHGFVDHVPDVFFLSILLFLGTFFIAKILKSLRFSRFFPHGVRLLISDFAVIIAIVSMVLLDFLLEIDTPKLEVPDDFQPTNPDRSWVINPFGKNPIYTYPLAILPALLATILIFMDQQITAVIVNRKENKLLKGNGYHLDLLIVATLILINSFLGLPWFVAATVLSITHVMSLKKESECTAPGEQPKFLGCREQRVTGVSIFLFIGLSVLMTKFLRIIPMPVLYGVFLYMGVSSLKGMQLCHRVMIMFMPQKYQPDYMFLRYVRIKRVHLFTFIQIMCLALLWVVKTIKEISIIFPLMVLAMCFVRKGMDWIFTRDELEWLDDNLPEAHHRDQEDELKKKEEEEKEAEELSEAATKFMDNQDSSGHTQIPIMSGNLENIPTEVMFGPNEVNISEEMSKTGIWKNLTASESSEKIKFRKGLDQQSKKTKRRTERESEELPTIPSGMEVLSPHRPSKGKKKPKKTHFYIDEEETDHLLDKDKPIEIVIEPPSNSSSMNNISDERV
ncbi:sodium bicarbonate cotransporter 3-like isoform X1 [Mytilus californianus]|uniref:sodium bicarbonate cotransporter 3-like isoform X1 n=1 Tax=Mytilus californianus TaxID=6549 RepID=UPI0022450C60|nr:sodium bicarbonate cotransporter 3-like isoform X1 [Mytilus californianus]